MTTEEEPFRFLKDEEFLALSVVERAAYLSRASQELEARQRLLRGQLDVLKKDVNKE